MNAGFKAGGMISSGFKAGAPEAGRCGSSPSAFHFLVGIGFGQDIAGLEFDHFDRQLLISLHVIPP